MSDYAAVPDESGHIDVPGGKVWYRLNRSANSGAVPLIVLHGGPGNSHDYLLPLLELVPDRSVVLYDESHHLTHYVTNSGFRLFDFNFWGEIPTAAQLQKICDEAMQVYQRLLDQDKIPVEPKLAGQLKAKIEEIRSARQLASVQPLRNPWME